MKTNEEIEELALKVLPEARVHEKGIDHNYSDRYNWIKGYIAAQQELFSLEDMSKCWNESAESTNKELSGIFEDSNSPWKPKTFDEFIKILKDGR